MKRLTLDETWKQCLRMWRWIADQIRNWRRLSVTELKELWLYQHGYTSTDLYDDCFFCEYCTSCENCPGRLVDSDFDCRNYPKWDQQPIDFYNQLRRLDRKRRKNKK